MVRLGWGLGKQSSVEDQASCSVDNGVRMAMGKCGENGDSGGPSPMHGLQDETGEGDA